MLEKLKDFAKGEEGYTAESLTWTAILGIGAATVVFGLYESARNQGAYVSQDVKDLQTPGQMPGVAEDKVLQEGWSGATTQMEIED